MVEAMPNLYKSSIVEALQCPRFVVHAKGLYGKSFGVFKLYGGSSLLFKICGECKRFVVKSLVCSTSFVAQKF